MGPLSQSWRRGTTAALSTTLVLGSLAACGSDGPGAADDTLEVWVYQDASTSVQADFVERFNETSDIQLELVEIPGENYQERMRTAMGTPNAPDIFFNWGGGSISDFVEEDMLVDLSEILIEEPEFRDAFIPTILDSGAVEGRPYGIPMRGMQPVILFYNTELFDEVGLDVPETWDEMTEAIDTFQAADITPVALGATDVWPSMMWLEYLMDRKGGPEVWQAIQDGDSEAWGDPASVWMAETTAELIDAGAFGANYLSTDYTNDGASTYFAQGRAAMHLMGSWEYANQLDNQPEFAENHLGYAPFPSVPDGAGDDTGVVGNPTNYWSVNSQVEGDRLDAAIDFLRTAASDEYAEALIENGDIPTTAGAEDLLEDHTDPEYARFQYDLVNEASAFTLSWDQALPARPASEMMDSIERLVNGQFSPEEFVDTMRDVG